jgi:hypothetical protein
MRMKNQEDAMNTARHPAAPTEADAARTDMIRTVCGSTLYAGDWPREAMVAAIGLTVAMDMAEARGDTAARMASGKRLFQLARDNVPEIADLIEPKFAQAA